MLSLAARYHVPRFSAMTLSFLFLTAGQQSARAELITGLTNQNSLITFDSATPGSIINSAGITGLLAGDVLVGIDRRPSLWPQQLAFWYGVGVNSGTGTGRVYTAGHD